MINTNWADNHSFNMSVDTNGEIQAQVAVELAKANAHVVEAIRLLRTMDGIPVILVSALENVSKVIAPE